MKITCKTCAGEGVVRCDDCNGTGNVVCDVRLINVEHYSPEIRDELRLLKDDMQRVVSQSMRLQQMKPERAAIYKTQAEATILTINKQAEALIQGD